MPPDSAFHCQTRLMKASRPSLAAAGLLTLHQLALDHGLGGDAGVVGARLPQHILAAHALEAAEDVLQRIVERVTHMQRAGHVGRRNHDAVGRRLGALGPAGAEGAGGLPSRVNAALDRAGLIGLVNGHGFASAAWRAKKPAPRPVSTPAPAARQSRSQANSQVSPSEEPSSPAPRKTSVRSIMLLAVAGFASQAQVRVTDSLLPQIAADFHSSVGAAAIVVTAYAITHGSIQLVIGPVGDRFGKYRTVALMCAIGAVLVAICGMAASLPQLALARLATGAAAGWVIPISMAYIGDVTPYERRQPILARYLTGQILGQLFGQAAGGVLGDLVGWRSVFFVLAGMFALATAGLVFELIANPQTRASGHPDETSRGFVADYGAVLSTPFARVVIIAAFIEGALAWGAFAYIGADLRARFGLSFTLVGVTVAFFGVGGLIYAVLAKLFVYRLGQTGLAATGGFVLAAGYIELAIGPAWWLAPAGVTAIGLGFYMLHNTLQTNATQMTPQARGTAVALFFLGALYRADRRRRRGRTGIRSFWRRAAVSRHRGNAARPRRVVCTRAAPAPPSQMSGQMEPAVRKPHTLTSGTLGTEPRRGGGSLPRGPGGLRRDGERRFLARRGSGSFSGRGVTGPSG